MYKINDEFVYHSMNGMDYKIIIININELRPENEIYGIDVFDNYGFYNALSFVGKNFLDKCERLQNRDSEMEDDKMNEFKIRDATKEEKEYVDNYIKKISKETGVIWDGVLDSAIKGRH